MSLKFGDVRWKKVVCEDLTVGEIREVVMDPLEWKVTHFVVHLTKEAAELVLGAKKG